MGRKRTKGLKKDRPAEPPRPLLATVTRERHGVTREYPRCQYWDMRRQDPAEETSPLVFHQCENNVAQKKAAEGFKVCGYHGVGFVERERKGLKQEVAKAGALGSPPAPDNALIMPQWFERNPDFKAMYNEMLNSPSLFTDFAPLMAYAKTAADYFMRRADLTKTEMRDGSDPPILRAINAIRNVMGVFKEFADYERRLPPVAHAEIERLKNAVGLAFARYVPRSQLAEAREFLAFLLERDDSAPVGRLYNLSGGKPGGQSGEGGGGATAVG